MGMHPPRRNVRQPRINFLADVDAVHEVIPRGCRWKASHEAEGLALHAASLRFCCRHARTLGARIGVGKRALPRGRSKPAPPLRAGATAGCISHGVRGRNAHAFRYPGDLWRRPGGLRRNARVSQESRRTLPGAGVKKPPGGPGGFEKSGRRRGTQFLRPTSMTSCGAASFWPAGLTRA